MGFQDFVTIGGWNIFVTLFNTLITFLIVKFLLFKPVRKVLAARAEEVQNMYDQAEADLNEAAKMKKIMQSLLLTLKRKQMKSLSLQHAVQLFALRKSSQRLIVRFRI